MLSTSLRRLFASEICSVGKYKGQPLEVAAQDTKWISWMKSLPNPSPPISRLLAQIAEIDGGFAHKTGGDSLPQQNFSQNKFQQSNNVWTNKSSFGGGRGGAQKWSGGAKFVANSGDHGNNKSTNSAWGGGKSHQSNSFNKFGQTLKI